MTKNIIVAVVIGILVLGVGAILLVQNRATDQTQQTTESSQIQQANPLSATVDLAAQNNSGEQGTATLTALEKGKTKVVLNLTGDPQDVTQPAHIHSGSCANLGGVLYPLTFPVNGVSETTLDVDLTEDILNKLPLAVNVHKSVAEANIYVSCGDIGASASGSGTNSTTPTAVPTIEDRRRGADKPED